MYNSNPFGPPAMSKTQMWAASSKSQFYNTDGTGRDTYISLHNGGFCPPHEPTKIEELGKWKFVTIYGISWPEIFLLDFLFDSKLPSYPRL